VEVSDLEEIMRIKNFGGFKRPWIGAVMFVFVLAGGLLAATALVGGAVINTCACGDTTAGPEQDRVLYPVKAGGAERSGQTGRPVVPEWRVLEGVSYENLTIFPVVSRAETSTSGFATLDEALSSGEAVVSESGGQIIRRSRDGRPLPYSGGPQVNQLVLINRGKRPLVLLAGEVVTGGKQDRVIAKDRIVPPGADPLPLDVFCVEHGRWTGASDQFNASKFMVHPSVREKAAVDQKQDEVWAAVRSGTTAAAPANAEQAAPAAVLASRWMRSPRKFPGASKKQPRG
jgi:hypothetical protein